MTSLPTLKVYDDKTIDNLTIEDNFTKLSGDSLLVTLSAAQSIADVTQTEVLFNTLSTLNDLTGYDTTSHTWTCPADGVYAIVLSLTYVTGAGTYRQAYFTTTTAAPPYITVGNHSANDTAAATTATSTYVGPVPQGIGLKFYTKQNSGGALNLGNTSSYLKITKLS